VALPVTGPEVASPLGARQPVTGIRVGGIPAGHSGPATRFPARTRRLP
jgi:hypothetical protein